MINNDELRTEVLSWLSTLDGVLIEGDSRETVRAAVQREFAADTAIFVSGDAFWCVLHALGQHVHEHRWSEFSWRRNDRALFTAAPEAVLS